MARDALVLILTPNHKACDILQEHQRDLALATELDKMRALLGRFGEQNPVVGDDPHRTALHMRKTSDQCLAIAWLKFIKARAVHRARNHFANVIRRAQIRGNNAKNLFGVIGRLLARLPVHAHGPLTVQMAHGTTRQRQSMRIIFCEVIRHTREARMHIPATQVFSCDNLARRRLYQGGACQEDCPLLFNNDGHIRHGRHISAPSRARPHNHGNLRNALGAHLGLIVKDTPEVVTVRENLVLLRQVRPTTVDQVDTGQAVLLRNLLGAQMLLYRHREIGAAFNGGIVANDHAFLPRDHTDPRNHPRRRRGIVIHPMRRRRADLQKRAPSIQEVGHTVTRQHLATAHMPLTRAFTAPQRCSLRRLSDNT